MYIAFGAQDDLSQGDIIRDVVISYVPNIATPDLYNEDGTKIEPDLTRIINIQDRIDLLTPAQTSEVIILSQACDCLSKPYLCVGRVIPLLMFDKGFAEKVASKKATLKSKTAYIQDLYQRPGAKPDAFYLQETAGFPKSVVSFLQLHSVMNVPENVSYLKEKRFLRLKEEAVFDLQFRLAFYFGRFATTEDYMLTDNEKSSLTPQAPTAVAQAISGE